MEPDMDDFVAGCGFVLAAILIVIAVIAVIAIIGLLA